MNTLNFQSLGRVPYRESLDLQDNLVAERRAGEIPDTILFLEHEPVYTIGRTRDQSSLANRNSLPHPVIEINRGGKATYHGPGQLVGYPILDLNGYGKDLHDYMRTLEDALIAACRDHGIGGARRKGLTGVWIDDRKIASIGVGVRHWISMHGFAINVCGDLSPFSTIIPCGIDNVTVTSVEKEIGAPVTVEAFAQTLRPHLTEALNALRASTV